MDVNEKVRVGMATLKADFARINVTPTLPPVSPNPTQLVGNDENEKVKLKT